METVVIGDITYTKASVLAREYGYTADYLGQLCRARKVTCELVGRTWYIDKTSLLTHREDKYKSLRQSEITSKINLKIDDATEGSAKKSEQVGAVLSKNTIKSFDTLTQKSYDPAKSSKKIVYESDNFDLFPQGMRRESPVSVIRPILSVPVTLGSSSAVEVVSDNPSVLALEFTEMPEVPLAGKVPVFDVPEVLPSDIPDLYRNEIVTSQQTEPSQRSNFLKKLDTKQLPRASFSPKSLPQKQSLSIRLVLVFCVLAVVCSTLIVTVDSYTIASGAAVYTGLVFNLDPLINLVTF